LVNQLNEQRPRCFDAIALLERVARLLHIKAEPVPAAVAAQGPLGPIILGSAAMDVIPLMEGGTIMRDPAANGWDGAGHLALFAPQESLLLDPTLDQIAAMTGFPTGFLIQEVKAEALDEDLAFESTTAARCSTGSSEQT
jgi:hypothetical protein